jgi:hypothetical protein
MPAELPADVQEHTERNFRGLHFVKEYPGDRGTERKSLKKIPK